MIDIIKWYSRLIASNIHVNELSNVRPFEAEFVDPIVYIRASWCHCESPMKHISCAIPNRVIVDAVCSS